MATDIAEQPAVLRELLAAADDIATVARAIAHRRPRFVVLVARGTSDHAALYAKYLVEIRLGLPAGLASPSTFTVYDAKPDLRDVLVIAVSQSGGSPDLTGSVQVARECGALTLALTNSPESALATGAEWHVDVRAGHERAIAATKTYTAELLALYLLFEAIRADSIDAPRAAAVPIPDLAAETLDDIAAPVAELAPRYRFAEKMIVTARGYSYATAREAALKLMETCYLAAQAFSAADLLHGPLAMIDREMPVIAIAADGKGGEAMRPVLEKLSDSDLVVVGSTGAQLTIPAVSEELSPVLEILPLQVLSRDLAVLRGGNPDAPRGLKKVTETW